jgi:hypothetical protein
MSRSPLGFYDNRPEKGITWTDGPSTRLFLYEARFPGTLPMKGTIRAHDKREAGRFIKARWPETYHLVRILGPCK